MKHQNMTIAESVVSNAEVLIRNAVSQFALPAAGRVLVGASGGKDSTFLAMLLKRLGYEVQCLTVDLGYPHFEAGRIRDNLRRLTVRGARETMRSIRAGCLGVQPFGQRSVWHTRVSSRLRHHCGNVCGK